MRSIVLGVVVFALATMCNDTPREDLGRDPDQPRLTGIDWSAPAEPPKSCVDIIPSGRDDAVHTLVFQQHCADQAIRYLETLAASDKSVLSDVIGAYYLRAMRDDRPADLLKALEFGQSAPRDDAAAQHNRGLVEKALGLDGITRGLERWQQNRSALRIALRNRNALAIARLINPFPAAALRFLEEELLPEWADDPTPDRLAMLELYAKVLSIRLDGDPYPLDAVRSLRNATPELCSGLIAFRDARWADRSARMRLFRKAALLLYGRSPLSLTALIQGSEASPASPRSPYLATLAHGQTGYFLSTKSEHVAALDRFDAAETVYAPVDDAEWRVFLQTSRAATLHDMQQDELAWREVTRGLQSVTGAADVTRIHRLLGEAARDAFALEYPNLALRYQNTAVALMRETLGATDPRDTDRIGDLQWQLGIALRERGAIKLEVGDATAGKDLSDATALGQKRDLFEAMRARDAELQGQLSLRNRQPERAIADFTRAVDLAPQEMQSFQASLLAQLAEAQQLAGHDHEQTLRNALDIITGEEKNQLRARRRGAREEIWSAYFNRFADVYERLIRHSFADRPEEAFLQAERATAFEPIDLILERKDVPAAFVAIAETKDVAAIRRQIPEGTVVIRYFVLSDRTYAWILSRDAFDHVELAPGKETIDRWARELQSAAEANDYTSFAARRVAPYSELVEPVLQRLATPPTRLVFIPDKGIHGLPIAALGRNDRYVIDEAPIELAGSTILYLYSVLRDRDLPRNESILLIGDPRFDERYTVIFGQKRLPAARLEVEHIAGVYRSHKLLEGDGATVQAFFNEAPKYGVIHIASHAVANPQEPFHSFLLFAPSQSHSGILDARALLTNLQLHVTRLVVLSACSSASGRSIGPEGVAPLVRPLVAAGVPAVVGTLWEVDDAPTKSLLVSFHRHFEETGDAALALRTAQLEMLGDRQAGSRSVLRWAPFQVIGHTGPAGAPNGGKDIVHSANLLQRPHGLHSQ